MLFKAIQYITVVSLLLPFTVVNATSVKNGDRPIPSHYIVVFVKGENNDEVVNRFSRRFSAIEVKHRYRHALHGMAVKMPAQLVTELAADPAIDYIEQDVMVSVSAQILPSGIDRINTDLEPAANIDGLDQRIDADIAILDTGIDLEHPDLNIHRYAYCKPRGLFNVNCIENDIESDDVNGHGTHVAGIAAALDNDIGVVGVAPGARLWAVKVLEDNGSGSASQIIAGVDYVAEHAAEIEVANMSLTGDGQLQALDDAIDGAVAAGVVFTLAAGNDHQDVSQVFPAGHPHAITVSAFEDYDGIGGGLSGHAGDDTFANFSNYGEGVDIMAPGVAIRSTVPGGGLGNKSGTSMASPHVAGAAALFMSLNPTAQPATVKAALINNADPAPCVNNFDGLCGSPEDPDGVQEPLLMLACDAGDGDACQPDISGIWPTDVNIGDDVSLFIFGSNFTSNGDTEVYFNGVRQLLVSHVSSEMLIVRLSSVTTDLFGPITIVTPAGAEMSESEFGSTVAGLSISGIWPGVARINEWSSIFLFGSGFTTDGGTAVYFNGVRQWNVAPVSSEMMIVRVQGDASLSGAVTVMTPADVVEGTGLLKFIP